MHLHLVLDHLVARCSVGGYNKGETNRFNLDVTVLLHRGALGGNSGVLPVKGGMYIHELERIPKDGLTGIQLKRNCGILPRSTDTTVPTLFRVFLGKSYAWRTIYSLRRHCVNL